MPPTGGPPKIPEGLHEELFNLSLELNPATGLPYADTDIAAWLKAHHGIEVSHDAVTRCLRPYRREAREARLERMRVRASEDLPGRITTHGTLMDQLLVDAKAAKTVAGRVRAIGEHRKGVEMLARIASGSVDVSVSGSPQGLAEFLSSAFGSGAS
jgi:hypothetical protein